MVPGARWHQQLRASALIALGLGRELALEAGVRPQPGTRRRRRWQASWLGACIPPPGVRLIGGLRSLALRGRLRGGRPRATAPRMVRPTPNHREIRSATSAPSRTPAPRKPPSAPYCGTLIWRSSRMYKGRTANEMLENRFDEPVHAAILLSIGLLRM